MRKGGSTLGQRFLHHQKGEKAIYGGGKLREGKGIEKSEAKKKRFWSENSTRTPQVRKETYKERLGRRSEDSKNNGEV